MNSFYIKNTEKVGKNVEFRFDWANAWNLIVNQVWYLKKAIKLQLSIFPILGKF